MKVWELEGSWAEIEENPGEGVRSITCPTTTFQINSVPTLRSTHAGRLRVQNRKGSGLFRFRKRQSFHCYLHFKNRQEFLASKFQAFATGDGGGSWLSSAYGGVREWIPLAMPF